MLPDLELLRPDQLEHPQDGVVGEERQRKEPERGGHPPVVDDVAVENEIDVEEDEHGHVPHARLHGNRGLQLAVHHAQQDEPGGDGPRAGPEHHDRPLEGIAGDAASEVQDEEQGQARKQTSAIEADKESVLQSEPQIHDEDYFIRKMRERVKAYHERSSSAEVLDRGEIYRPQQQAERIREAAAYRAKEADKTPKQMDLFEENFLKREVKAEYTLIGQVFDTYWLVQFQDSLYIIDQHAAHERVMYERTLKEMKSREYTSQYLSPPIILSLSMQEAQLLEEHIDRFTRIGFEIEHFGGEEYAVRAVPDNLFGIAKKELLMEMIDDLADGINTSMTPDLIDEKVASMSCKAAVKGNNRLSAKEVDALIGELLTVLK